MAFCASKRIVLGRAFQSPHLAVGKSHARVATGGDGAVVSLMPETDWTALAQGDNRVGAVHRRALQGRAVRLSQLQNNDLHDDEYFSDNLTEH